MRNGRHAFDYVIETQDGLPWCDGSNGTVTVSGVGSGHADAIVGTAVVVQAMSARHDGPYSDAIPVVVTVR
jgi:spore coat protein U-like protein